MELLGFWLVFSIVVGIAAHSRGRSGVAWFFISCVLSPLLAVILVLVLSDKRPQVAPAKSATGGSGDDPRERIKCPECAELVLAEAKKCKHCGAQLTVPEPAVFHRRA